MRGKNKSFIEDTIILFVIGLLVYGVYAIFFSSDEIQTETENKATLEQKVETPKEIIPEKKVEEEIKKEENPSAKLENKVNEVNLTPENKIISEKESPKKEEIIQAKIVESSKPLESNVVQTDNLTAEKAKTEAFYQTIREKINSNIDKSSLKSGEYINIRLTILKDGKQEQLTFMDGNKEYFELVKPSIYKTFPIVIPSDMKDSFPRYFRMKIEF